MDNKIIIMLACLGYFVLLSLITFIVYGIDKTKAKKGKWRVKEARLLILSLIGGAMGGFIAMKKFRHKTTKEHWYFTFVNVLGIIIHLVVLVFIYIKL